MTKFLLFIFFTFGAHSPLCAAVLDVEAVLEPVRVDASGDRNVFANTLDYFNGYIVTAHVEPPDGDDTGMNLHTVVRLGKRNALGGWNWSSKIIEENTLRDEWHTQASAAFDRDGYIHVAYNMHNMPWQYSISCKPFDIECFTFKGQKISDQDRIAVKIFNKTPFPSNGNAAIPRNQITYPIFSKNPDGDLFISYRFALYPANEWEGRQFSGAIAKYDSLNRTWHAFNPIENSTKNPTISNQRNSVTTISAIGKTIYLPKTVFLPHGILLMWAWRDIQAGENVSAPLYIYFKNSMKSTNSASSNYDFPSAINDDFSQKYFAARSVAQYQDSVFVLINPINRNREIYKFSVARNKWDYIGEAPSQASEILVDENGTLWAFSTGIKVFRRTIGSVNWEFFGEIGENLCFPKVVYFDGHIFLHSKSCDGKNAGIFSLRVNNL